MKHLRTVSCGSRLSKAEDIDIGQILAVISALLGVIAEFILGKNA